MFRLTGTNLHTAGGLYEREDMKPIYEAEQQEKDLLYEKEKLLKAEHQARASGDTLAAQ
ncbi:MAG: hypothetical protein LUE93_02165 [Bacteroides sp.]|nr:hypothetical protein [Bacteroides sp.]